MNTAKNAITIAIVAVSLIQGEGRSTERNDRCQQWAVEINAGRDSKRMHQMGCDDHTSNGRYAKTSSQCATVAYNATLRDRNPVTAVKKAGFTYFEDGTCQ